MVRSSTAAGWNGHIWDGSVIAGRSATSASARFIHALMTVSIRNARPSLKYSFTRECLYPTLTSTPLVTTRVAKTPVVVLLLGIRRPKITSTFSGRPRSRLFATSASKNARPLRGSSNTIVRDTSTCRIDNSHQYPCSRSAAVNGSGNPGHHRSANAAMSAGPSRSQIVQPGRIIGIGETVGQRGESDARLRRLLLGPFMAVQPDFDRIGQVGADLHECRAEVLIPQIEVETRNPPLRPTAKSAARSAPTACTPLKMRSPVTLNGSGTTGRDPLELLSHPDRGESRSAGRGLPVQERAHHIELARVLGEQHHRHACCSG